MIKAFVAYLLGSLMGGLIVGKLRGGVDIRAAGSGNPGATNAWRTQGPVFGMLVFVIDVGKGILATLVLPRLALPGLAQEAAFAAWTPYLCGLGVMLGHVYPVFFGFRGGKGVATLIGVWACLLPQALPYALVAWLLLLVLTGYVSVASLGSSLVICGAAVWQQAPQAAVFFACASALLLFYTHRLNLLRLRDGTENRFRKVMLLRRG
ncbi:MAG: glycerol-3-phosphate 1-O-acyltransferase PlsY [Acidobacteria bacterium]|nr:glycerol-3-phosphate 1-O-acyltransferase PlsY [Acidobacteriota bacterium]